MLKHYVEWAYPDIIASSHESEPIKERTVEAALALRKKDAHSIAFRFYSRVETEGDGETLRGKRRDVSGHYYLGGVARTLAEVKRDMPQARVLIDNMRCNEMERVVCVGSRAFELYPEDVVLELVANVSETAAPQGSGNH